MEFIISIPTKRKFLRSIDKIIIQNSFIPILQLSLNPKIRTSFGLYKEAISDFRALKPSPDLACRSDDNIARNSLWVYYEFGGYVEQY